MSKQGKIWYGVFPWQGRKKWIKLSHNKKDSERMLAEIMRDVHAGTYQALEDIRFRDLVEKWIEAKDARLKPSTMHGYRSIVKHLVGYFGESPIDELRSGDIEDYVLEKVKESELSNKTIGYHLGALKAIFKQAIIWGYLVDNPAQHIKRPRAEHKEISYLSPDELTRLLEACPDNYYPFILTAAMTGMRWSEIIELRWMDLNPKESTLSVTRTVYKGMTQTPKSKASQRKVIVPETLVHLLKGIQDVTQPEPEDLIFSNSMGNHLNPTNFYRDMFRPMVKKAKVRSISFHGLRHTYATGMLSNGASLLFVQQQLGHDDIQTTLKHYGHVLPKEAHRYVDEYQRLILGSNMVVSPDNRKSEEKKNPS
ncbi:MAG: site-specific integrase [Candidatus Aquicultor sp.]|nr:site-specific integrase [Candidatus Aquicultor sp.]